MTLTDQLPSLRRTLPDPIALDAWPEDTRARIDDVVVGGLSLRAVVAVTGTPCVHAGAAVVPGTGGVPSPDRVASVVVAMVVAVTSTEDLVGIALDVDAGDAPLDWAETRLVGRASTARRRRSAVVRDGRIVATAPLVADVAPGDLLAIPCAGSVHVRAGVLVPGSAERVDWLPLLR
ncbi:hypothetical protein [Agrococcus sp. SGAir0287]|uniref:hypothetical protein n=1 Tax=Agrococcus sp. SGAir0287 TaxID=2070347 RepID=UPI0010CCE351|nr:hypothetical protein [Agrococcus sp. SGAir0287]QCR20341.1 hypothetical protein C1N71_13560 [Agrococcus sp. SGAir0287]